MIDDPDNLEPAPLRVQLERARELIRQHREVIALLERENALLRGKLEKP